MRFYFQTFCGARFPKTQKPNQRRQIQFRLQNSKVINEDVKDCMSVRSESAADIYSGNSTLPSWILLFKWMNGWRRSQKGGWRGSHFPLAVPIHALVAVGNVEEKVLFMVLLRKQIVTKRGRESIRTLSKWQRRETQWVRPSPGTTNPWWLRWVEWRCLQRRREHPLLSSGFFSGWGSKTGPLKK